MDATTNTSSKSADLALAHALADFADRVTMSRFRSPDLQVATKDNLTPVTDADRAAEAAIREELAVRRPDDSVYGEEMGTTGDSSRMWIIDPIDGTKNFLRGVPVWATLIALVEDGEVTVGVVSAPALSRRWWAATSVGAYSSGLPQQAGSGFDYEESGERIHVSNIDKLADASLSYSSLTGWKERGRLPQFLELTEKVWRTRAYGDFWSYMMVAEGIVDLAAEPELETYDMAALVPIVVEAGGRFTSLAGAPGPWGENAIASNGLLHDDVLALLDWE
ncbi:MAG: histidinol-phosphatase [Actinomycetaceae bacterium]|nr:histidinol-phosphatase [Actinomycetaceae bacterium]